ncbi:hypothetical protein [Nitrosomonas communis]|uniref:hypothetical protein n=1 Tax=Nitrosomonas communis TaxID=44574 RepID=UPI003D2A6952
MVFAAFIGFFFYRDGEALIQTLRKGMIKLLGFSFGVDSLATIHNIVTGVVYGIFGAASAQAIAGTIGFFIAGIPGAFLLGAATFVLSLILIALLYYGAALCLVCLSRILWLGNLHDIMGYIREQ